MSNPAVPYTPSDQSYATHRTVMITGTKIMIPTTTEPAAANHQSNGKSDAELELLALAELDKKLLVARDRIRMVARGQTPGFYWHGRPGTCKTHTVLAVLDEMGV